MHGLAIATDSLPTKFEVSVSICLSYPVCNVGVLWPNGRTDQDETLHAGSPRPWPYSVKWDPAPPRPKGGRSPPIFGPYLLRPNGCRGQDSTWYGGWTRPRRLCVRWEPAPPLQKGGGAPPTFFLPMFIVVKRLDGSRW